MVGTFRTLHYPTWDAANGVIDSAPVVILGHYGLDFQLNYGRDAPPAVNYVTITSYVRQGMPGPSTGGRGGSPSRAQPRR